MCVCVCAPVIHVNGWRRLQDERTWNTSKTGIVSSNSQTMLAAVRQRNTCTETNTHTCTCTFCAEIGVHLLDILHAKSLRLLLFCVQLSVRLQWYTLSKEKYKNSPPGCTRAWWFVWRVGGWRQLKGFPPTTCACKRWRVYLLLCSVNCECLGDDLFFLGFGLMACGVRLALRGPSVPSRY